MSGARPIGEIAKPILERCAKLSGFQELLAEIRLAESCKEFIVTAAMSGILTPEEAGMLIAVYQLETV